MQRILLAGVLAASVSACATGTTNITMAAPAAKAGVLSEAPATRIDVPAVTDARAKPDRVGDKRNGYGMVMGKIGAAQPPAQTVELALEQVVSQNKQILGAAEDRYALQATLKNFWLDYKTGLVTVEFYGNIEADVALMDRTTGAKLYSESFTGYYSEKTGGGLSKTWARIMDGALADFTTKVSMSEGLKNAVAATHAPATTASNGGS